jgi:hypothetical protein
MFECLEQPDYTCPTTSITFIGPDIPTVLNRLSDWLKENHREDDTDITPIQIANDEDGNYRLCCQVQGYKE